MDENLQNPVQGETKQQLKGDAKDVAAAAAKGAVTGGLVGAARGAAIGLVKSKTGKKAMTTAAACALVPPLIFGAMFGMGAGGASESNSMNAAKNDAVIVTAAQQDFGDKKEALAPIRSAASQSAVPWTILAAIYNIQSSKNVLGGVTDYGLDKSKLKDTTWDKTRATDIDYVSSFVATRIQHYASTGEVSKNQVSSPFAGRVAKMNGDKLEIVIGDSEEHKEAAKIARESWIADLSKVELVGNPDLAEKVYELAEKWSKNGQEQCTVGGSGTLIETQDGVAGSFAGTSMNARQVGYAQAVIDTVAAMGLPERAAEIALITVSQESTFRMWWNSSVPGSYELTEDKDAEGGYDLGGGRKSLSVGLYQQQIFSDGTWGTVEDGMSPQRSTENFLKALQKIKGWESMEAGAAAQAVQRSAHPSRYSRHLPMAQALIKALPPGTGGFGSDHSQEAVHNSSVNAQDPATGSSSSEGSSETVTESSSNPHNLSVDTSLKPDIQAVQAATIKYFAEHIYAMGGYREGSVGHSQRIASDLMVVDYKTDAGIKAGDKMAAFFIENRKQLGVDYVIWRDKIWLGESKGWQEYSKGGFGKHLADRGWNDTTLHNDHLHVETLGNSATGGDLKLDGIVVGSSGGSSSDSAGCGQSGTSPTGVETSGEDDYPYRMPGDVSWRPGSKDPGADPWGFFKRECVSFVAWRLNQQMGWTEGKSYPFTKATMGFAGGNAKYWGDTLRRKGYKVDMNPVKGAVAWWDAGAPFTDTVRMGPYGHVAVVLQVNDDGTVLIEQYNGGTRPGHPSTASYSTVKIKKEHVSGYIHVADIG